MAYMTLGGYTFERNPTNATAPKVIGKKKSYAVVETYSSVAYFSWGLMIAGYSGKLEWTYMTDTQFKLLKTLYENDAAVVLDPKDGTNKTYSVQINDFYGTMWLKMGDGASDVWRQNVVLEFTILSEV